MVYQSVLRSQVNLIEAIMVGLTPEQKKFYKDNGYILIKDALTKEEVDEMSDEYDALFKRKNLAIMEQSWVGRRDDDLRISDSPYTVKGIHNLQSHHACFGRFLTNDKVLDIVEDIMDNKNIMLHHTKAHFKPPSNGALYPMHQDYPYFPYEKCTPVAAFVHLDAANPENGGLFVYPGSHKLGPLPDDESAEEDNYHFVDKKKWPLEKATPVVAERGDVVFFSCLLIHGSSHNTSTRPRRMFLAQFVSADDKFVHDNVRVQPGYGWMLRGVNVNKNESTAERFSHT